MIDVEERIFLNDAVKC